MPEAILGISAYFHDSAAALLVDGEIVAAAQEERFTRVKNDASFPSHAVEYVLREGGLSYNELSAVAYYEKPLLKFERLLETYHAFAPRGLKSFLKAMPVWMKEKVFFRRMLGRELGHFGKAKIPMYFPEHHLSHAASAFYPSPFQEAAILTVDGVGEWANTTIGFGKGNEISIFKEQHFPHSLGLLYSAFTYYLGFEVNGGEYKLMGLAAYGSRHDQQTLEFISIIREKLVDIRMGGSILLNMQFFDFATALRMVNNRAWQKLFSLPKRNTADPITQQHANLAIAIQILTEEIVGKLAVTALELSNASKLVMAGGVALNSVANGKLLDLPELDKLWVQPAAGDAGGALGAALAVHHILHNNERYPHLSDAMQNSCLGPEFGNKAMINSILKHGLPYQEFADEHLLCRHTARLLAEGKVVGWFRGRMEYGPRALGNRSILGDPRNPEMQQKINLSIKFRESFRPFAPAVLEEDASLFFDLNVPSPYMLLVRKILPERKVAASLPNNVSMMERIKQTRSHIPAVTHVDDTARIQTVDRTSNTRFRKLLEAFKAETGCGMLINTSFNVKDEPIVCSPDDAIRCFMSTEMDVLVLGDFVLSRKSPTLKD